jgi:hypothetical protein
LRGVVDVGEKGGNAYLDEIDELGQCLLGERREAVLDLSRPRQQQGAGDSDEE